METQSTIIYHLQIDRKKTILISDELENVIVKSGGSDDSAPEDQGLSDLEHNLTNIIYSKLKPTLAVGN